MERQIKLPRRPPDGERTVTKTRQQITPSRLYPTKATLKKWCKIQAERVWMAKLRKETKVQATYRHTPIPTKKILQLHEGLSKRESALLVQIRTEKIVLRDFLFQRRMPDVPFPRYECGERRQTVIRILLRCNMYKTSRTGILEPSLDETTFGLF